MPCIYLTVNHWNIYYNVKPYYYIGSNQTDNPNYFGSSKKLKKDIEILGKEFFEKIVLYQFYNIENKELRSTESVVLKVLNCASNNKYYNKTNTSLPGYRETIEEKDIRIKNSINTRKRIKEEKGFIIPLEKRQFGEKNPMFGKTIYQYWIKKHGETKANELWAKKLEKNKEQLKNNNPCKKIINDELLSKMLTLLSQGFKQREITEKLQLNKWLVARYCKAKNLILYSHLVKLANIPLSLCGADKEIKNGNS